MSAKRNPSRQKREPRVRASLVKSDDNRRGARLFFHDGEKQKYFDYYVDPDTDKILLSGIKIKEPDGTYRKVQHFLSWKENDGKEYFSYQLSALAPEKTREELIDAVLSIEKETGVTLKDGDDPMQFVLNYWSYLHAALVGNGIDAPVTSFGWGGEANWGEIIDSIRGMSEVLAGLTTNSFLSFPDWLTRLRTKDWSVETLQTFSKRKRRTKTETWALILGAVQRFPHATDKEIARHVGCSRQYLHTFPQYREARRKARGEAESKYREHFDRTHDEQSHEDDDLTR